MGWSHPTDPQIEVRRAALMYLTAYPEPTSLPVLASLVRTAVEASGAPLPFKEQTAWSESLALALVAMSSSFPKHQGQVLDLVEQLRLATHSRSLRVLKTWISSDERIRRHAARQAPLIFGCTLFKLDAKTYLADKDMFVEKLLGATKHRPEQHAILLGLKKDDVSIRDTTPEAKEPASWNGFTMQLRNWRGFAAFDLETEKGGLQFAAFLLIHEEIHRQQKERALRLLQGGSKQRFFDQSEEDEIEGKVGAFFAAAQLSSNPQSRADIEAKVRAAWAAGGGAAYHARFAAAWNTARKFDRVRVTS